MTAELVGGVSIGACVPTTAALVAGLTAELQGKLTGLLSVSAALSIQPPALAAQVDGALKLVAQLEAMVSAGLTVSPPGVTLNIAAVASLIGELNASLAALLALTVTLGTAGVYVLVHNGAEETFGPQMQPLVSSIAPPGNNVYAVTFLATDPAVFEALGKVLLTG